MYRQFNIQQFYVLPTQCICLFCVDLSKQQAVAQLVETTAVQAGRSRVRFPMRSLGCLSDLLLPAALWPGVAPASNRNDYQDYFLGVKVGRCVGLTTLLPSFADCLEILGASNSWNPQSLYRPS